jgi:hypothetical protein
MKKKLTITILVMISSLGLTIQPYLQNVQQSPPEIITLAENSKLGKVTFNHLNHTTKNFSPDGTAQLKCVDCHHVEQPKSETVKFAFPENRTVILTAETVKDAATPKVSTCRSCHTEKDVKPTLVAEIPQIKNEKGDVVVMTNQNAFHRNCASCHDQVLKLRPTATAPGTSKCMSCHKKG